MNKYEKRRLRLIDIKDTLCDGKIVELARRIDREQSYVSRMLYPEGKKWKKRIADEMVDIIEDAFNLPKGWLDGINNDLDIKKERILSKQHEILLDLFDSLPKSKKNKFIKELAKEKDEIDNLIAEIKELHHNTKRAS
ncbi:hypothetical protein [Arsenophonus sp.]|uniref:hypothetical protein n=1 Tax=Arsenophonus sp. TaxID=1872640 RepID=UPI003879538E